MGPNHKICSYATRQLEVLSSARNILVVGPRGLPPDALIHLPIHGHSGARKECIDDPLIPARHRAQFHEYRCGNHHLSELRRGIQRLLRFTVQRIFRIPKSDQYIRVDRCHNSPRTSRTQRKTAFFPEPIPGVPMPRNSSNTLPRRCGEMTTLFPCFRNTILSPAATPNSLRNSRGTVICPLLVIFATRSISPLLTFVILLLTFIQST
jgi:hypothetical protein